MKQPKTYWEHSDFEVPYQHGRRKHRVYLLDLLKEKGVKSLLDVGCGNGSLWSVIKEDRSKYNFTYLGVDYSRTMIESAKRTFSECAWFVEDARHLNQADNSWDCVLLMHCLDHLDDYESAIREAARVAQRYVCIILWRPFVEEGTRLNPRNMYGKKEGEEPWEDTYLHEYSSDVLDDEFSKNNLIIEHIAEGEIINDPRHYNWLCLLKKK